MFNAKNLARGWQTTKRVIGDAWHGATKIASQFDSGMKVGRRLLASVAPIFDQLGQSHQLKRIMSGITAYDKGRGGVMDGYSNVQNHYNRIRRQVPELDL